MLPKSLSAPQTGYTVLKPFLQQQGREPDRVLGDGNCLLLAPSWTLTGIEDHHTDLRRTIVEFEAAIFQAANNAINSMKTRPAIPFAEYTWNMKKVCVWGTNHEIIAAASLRLRSIWPLKPTTLETHSGYSILQNQCLSCLTRTSKNILLTSLSPPTH